MAVTQVSGLVSGIDSQSIIAALVKADQATTQTLTDSKTTLQAQMDAVRSLNAKALSAQLDLSDLRRTSTYTARTASTSDDTALTATASSSAAIGSYALDVVTVAQAHQLKSTAQASASDNLGAGTFSVRVGNGAVTNINFDASASSLNDVAQAINQAKLGVNASVVNDGSTGTPYRLILSSTTTGTANALTIAGTGGFSSLATGMTQLTAAADASIRLGTGTSAIVVSSPTNTVTSVIPGVTLNLKQPQDGLTVTVGTDSSTASTAMKTFVDSYNAMLTYAQQNASYDTTTNTGGILLSQTDMISEIQAATRALTGSVPGLPAAASTLSSLGLTLSDDGKTLQFDQPTFDAQYQADPDAVMRILANSGTSSLSGISFAGMSANTSTESPFSVDVLTAASQASYGGGAPVAPSTVIDGSDNSLAVSINGNDYAVTLANGTYTPSAMAQQVQSAINALASPSDQVTVGLDGNGALSVRTKFYGSNQKISVDTANAALGLSVGSAAGTDVIASIDGGAPITGKGQVLTGASGTPSDGLVLTVTATGPLTGAVITVRKGLAVQADEQLSRLTDVTSGTAPAVEDGLTASITDVTNRITERDAEIADREARYQVQFTTMEQLIAQFKAQGDGIASLIGALPSQTAASTSSSSSS